MSGVQLIEWIPIECTKFNRIQEVQRSEGGSYLEIIRERRTGLHFPQLGLLDRQDLLSVVSVMLVFSSKFLRSSANVLPSYRVVVRIFRCILFRAAGS